MAVTPKLARRLENSGNNTVLDVVLKMVRQPRTLPGTLLFTGVQAIAPTYSRWFARPIFPWWPSVMFTGADEVIAAVLTICSVPVEPPTGVPATYKLLPLSRPVVAAATGTEATVAGGPLKSTSITLAEAPAHSAPQFRMKTWVSLALNTPKTGWSWPGRLTAVAALAAVSITKNALVRGAGRVCGSSAKTSSLLPFGLSTSRRGEGTDTKVTVASAVVTMATWPVLRTAA